MNSLMDENKKSKGNNKANNYNFNSKKDTDINSTAFRRPVQIVKKRSGTLENLLEKLNNINSSDIRTKHISLESICSEELHHIRSSRPCAETVASSSGSSLLENAETCHAFFQFPFSIPSSTTRRKSSLKEKKEKKRERWLLTRKTWKYMTDAGRKLIPDGLSNHIEDLPSIERHFHHVCAAESKFLLWRRKSSYPGANRVSKRHYKRLLSHTGQKSTDSSAYVKQLEEASNVDYAIEILQSFLNLDETRKTTTLLGSKTERPDQTASPSAKRPHSTNSAQSRQYFASYSSYRLSSEKPKALETQSHRNQLLLERLKKISHTSSICHRITDSINPEILENKALLKQIYNELKKQQLHRLLDNHSMPLRANLVHSSSMSRVYQKSNDKLRASTRDLQAVKALNLGDREMPITTTASFTTHTNDDNIWNRSVNTWQHQSKQRTTVNIVGSNYNSLDPSHVTEKQHGKLTARILLNTCGTQTNFISLNELIRLAKEYKDKNHEEPQYEPHTKRSDTDDECCDKTAAKVSQPHLISQYFRKSSFDNDDVSQSVSDTIKRYLRMTRKKSFHADNANRFKSVNYDRFLCMKRNSDVKHLSRANEDSNSKTTQTLDAWALITLEFIRGKESRVSSVLQEAHAQLDKCTKERFETVTVDKNIVIRNQKDDVGVVTKVKRTAFNKIIKKAAYSSSSVATALSSPANILESSHDSSTNGGILHSSTQFLSNLWHGNTGNNSHQIHPNLIPSPTNSNACTLKNNINQTNSNGITMQKSKSSSNIGQFVSKKLLKSRSKSQTQPLSQIFPKWTPADKNTWISDDGGRIILSDVMLLDLSDLEAKMLQKVAIEKINELCIGVNIVVPNEHFEKSGKIRPGSKKKTIPVAFFDIGKKDDKNKKEAGSSVFGISLESYMANDKQRRFNSEPASFERSSRNSLASLFRSSSSKVRSCECLPSTTMPTADTVLDSRDGACGESGEGFIGDTRTRKNYTEISNLGPVQGISRSQHDMRRISQDFDCDMLPLSSLTSISSEKSPLVPTFINACIRHIEEHGLHLVGIFRVSTSKKRVRQLREEFERNVLLATSVDAKISPHDIATLLKEFLRDLPEPLLCQNLYKPFLETQRIRNRRLQFEAISHLVKLLPIAHRDTLYVLLKFLANVAAHCDDVYNSDGTVQIIGNKMDSNNLATVFAPNILRSTSVNGDTQAATFHNDTSSEQASMADAINVIRIMIDHYEALFHVPAELIDAVYAHIFDACPQQLNFLCERQFIHEKDKMEGAKSLYQVPGENSWKSHHGNSIESTGQKLQGNNSTETGKPLQNTILKSTKLESEAIAPTRKVYTRESVMHKNSASKEVYDSSYNISQSRRSKSKRTESGGRIYDLRHNSERESATKYVDSEKLQSKPQQLTTSTSKYKPTLYAMKKTAVVTGTLKLPVQLQTSALSTAKFPAIETSDQFSYSSQNIKHSTELSNESDFSITGYLSYGGTPDKYKEEKNCTPSYSTKTRPCDSLKTHNILSTQPEKQLARQKTYMKTIRTKSLTSMPYTSTLDSLNNENNKVNKYAVESEVNTCLPNVGVILRSKNLDVERMASSASVTNIPHISSQSEGTLSATPIYKRQALISSAKNVKTNK